jgi:CzcA family heavy metal efflux pump
MSARVDSIIRWSLHHRPAVLALAALVFLVGVFRASQTPVDVFPDLTAPVVTVIAEAHGMAPEEVEALVTLPIETAMNGAYGVRRVRSSTSIGVAIVWVEFLGDVDVLRARQIVAEKLQVAEGTLPRDIPRPIVAPVSSNMGEIVFVALTSDRHTALDLKTTADWTIRRRLLAVAGVSQVIPIGGETKQYQVRVLPERLAAYALGLNDVIVAMRRASENATAGFYVEGAQEYLIRAVGRVHDAEEIGASVVAVRGGHPILVRDLAEVTIGAAPKRGEGSYKGHPAVVIGIQKQPGANTAELTRRIDTVLDELQTSLPEGMKIERDAFRQADFIATALHNVEVALRDGALLVVLVVALFLASARATLITLVALPLSLAVAVLVLAAMGGTINTMTLGGMAIAIGELVDDAIIDVENVVRRLGEQPDRPALDVVFEASSEIRSSIVFATFVILVVFTPLLFLSGVEGRLLRPLGIAYAVSLAASLLVALTVTPVLCSLLLPAKRKAEPRWVLRLRDGYERLLARVVDRVRLVSAGAGLLLVLAFVVLLRAGHAFLPEFHEGALTISVVTLPGTSLETSDRLGRQVEEILLTHAEVLATTRRTGRAELDEHAQGVHAAEIDVRLDVRKANRDELLATLRKELSIVPGTQIAIGQPISHRIDHMLSGTRANIAVKVFGEDLGELRRIAGEVREVMSGVPGVVDLALEQQPDVPLLTMRLDRAAVAQHGLVAADVAESIEAAFIGQAVARVREKQTSFDLVVRLDRAVLGDLESISSVRVSTPAGAQVPLRSLASIFKDRGPSTISRESVQRKMVVMCNVAGRDLGSVVDELRARIGKQVKLPAGYRVEYGGQIESATEATRTILLLSAVALVAVFLLLAAALSSARDALLVLVNLPLALIGGVAGLYLTGGVISVATLVGFITLLGIATRNGLMLVSHVHHLVQAEGVEDPRVAVLRASRERLVPILMTALAAGLALVPLAFAGGKPGSEIQSPMAVVILCGLLTSTALNAFVLPALYLRFGALRA